MLISDCKFSVEEGSRMRDFLSYLILSFNFRKQLYASLHIANQRRKNKNVFIRFPLFRCKIFVIKRLDVDNPALSTFQSYCYSREDVIEELNKCEEASTKRSTKQSTKFT